MVPNRLTESDNDYHLFAVLDDKNPTIFHTKADQIECIIIHYINSFNNLQLSQVKMELHGVVPDVIDIAPKISVQVSQVQDLTD